MARCPTCGATVANFFEHVDSDEMCPICRERCATTEVNGIPVCEACAAAAEDAPQE